jgi:hypothetical protein
MAENLRQNKRKYRKYNHNFHMEYMKLKFKSLDYNNENDPLLKTYRSLEYYKSMSGGHMQDYLQSRTAQKSLTPRPIDSKYDEYQIKRIKSSCSVACSGSSIFARCSAAYIRTGF